MLTDITEEPEQTAEADDVQMSGPGSLEGQGQAEGQGQESTDDFSGLCFYVDKTANKKTSQQLKVCSLEVEILISFTKEAFPWAL